MGWKKRKWQNGRDFTSGNLYTLRFDRFVVTVSTLQMLNDVGWTEGRGLDLEFGTIVMLLSVKEVTTYSGEPCKVYIVLTECGRVVGIRARSYECPKSIFKRALLHPEHRRKEYTSW